MQQVASTCLQIEYDCIVVLFKIFFFPLDEEVEGCSSGFPDLCECENSVNVNLLVGC